MRPAPGLLLMLAPFACSGDPAALPGGGGPGATVAQLPAQLVATACALLFRCPVGKDDLIGTRLFLGDEVTCRAYAGGDIDPALLDLVRAVSAGRVDYDGEKMQACLGRSAGDCGLVGQSLADLARGCGAFTGKIPLQGACARSEECAGDAYCGSGSTTQITCPGACTARAAVGAACQSDEQCSSAGLTGLVECQYDTQGNGACRERKLAAARAAEDAACGLDMATFTETICADGLWCDLSGKRCRRPIPAGDTCGGSDDFCAGDTLCSASAGGAPTCRALTLQRTEGAGCDNDTQFCHPIAGLECMNAQCTRVTPAGAEGNRCRRGDYAAHCDPGLYCDTTQMVPTCSKQKALGAGCINHRECEGAACSAGICTAQGCFAL